MDNESKEIKFDLVVPVFNSLHHVRQCIQSIFKNSTLPYHLYLVDDCCDEYVYEEINKILNNYDKSNFTLLRNEKNLGYLKSCNRGISAGSSEFVVTINSDTIITEGHLEKLTKAFKSSEKIGVVNPVSTWANWTKINFPAGTNINSLADAVNNRKVNFPYKDIYDASGFYFATRRKLYDQLGLFDEIYDPGYFEEADFCMKVLKANYRVIMDESLFIFHHGWGSFGQENRNPLMKANKKIFMEKWEKEYEKYTLDWKKELPVSDLNNYLDNIERNNKKTPSLLGGKGAEALITKAKNDFSFALTLKEKINKNSGVKKDKKLKVIYIAPAIKLYGGIISILQVVNQLNLNGIDASIATAGEVDQQIFRTYPMYFSPYFYENIGEMAENFPECDLVVATSWDTVYSTLVISALRGFKNAYFVQDFEADFIPKSQKKLRAQAENTYSLIDDKIVKTEWLKNKVKFYGGETRVIPLGLNTDLFYPSKVERSRQVIAMARPSSKHRNFEMVKKVYEELAVIDPSIKLAFYGVPDLPEDFKTKVKDYGKLTNLRDVASALNESQVLLDCSLFQGFGRPGLEAMACKTASVLTQVGGITSYAKHDYNCLLCNPSDKNDIITKVLTLLNDEEKRSKLIDNGINTVLDYSYISEGKKTANYFESLFTDGVQSLSNKPNTASLSLVENR